jgi:hypothetical protein
MKRYTKYLVLKTEDIEKHLSDEKQLDVIRNAVAFAKSAIASVKVGAA